MESLFFGNYGLVHVATSNKLNQTEQRLLLLILGLSNKEGVCTVPMAWLSAALHLARPNVSRVIKGLVSQNIVTRMDEGNRGLGAKAYVFRFNPNPDTYAFNAQQEAQEAVSDTPAPPAIVLPYQKQIDDLTKKYETEREERKAANVAAAASKKELDESASQIKELNKVISDKNNLIEEKEQQIKQKDEEFRESINRLTQELRELRSELDKPLLQKISDSLIRLFSKSKKKTSS